MNLGTLPVFKMMTTKMDWLAQRQRVLAQNIANADTPGYVPKDLKKIDYKQQFRRETFRLQLATTSPKHITSKIQQSSFGDAKETKKITRFPRQGMPSSWKNSLSKSPIRLGHTSWPRGCIART